MISKPFNLLLFALSLPFAEASSLQFSKWSGDLNIPDPVAVSVDPQGRVFVTQTQRRKVQDLDIRQHRSWIPTDVGLETIEQKRAFYHRELAPERGKGPHQHVADFNGDGSADYRDLMILSEKIHLLEDRNGDGTADHMQTFAEGFQTEVTGIAAGVLWYAGDVYATIAPDVWRLSDTNGDGKADERESIATGFGPHIAYGGHDMHGLIVGPDGKLYWTIGDKGLSVLSKEGKRFHYPNQGAMMRCNPDGTNFEVFAHGLRNLQEPAFDEFGNWFGVDNDADMTGERERFIYIVPGMDAGWRCNYQYRGDHYNPWLAERLHLPHETGRPAYALAAISSYEDGPCGFAYNPGTALGPEWAQTFFMTGAPRGNQFAFQVEPEGAYFKMVNSRKIGSGVAMTGWCFGPDGALYGSDWGGGYPLNQSGAVWRIDVAPEEAYPERYRTAEILKMEFREVALDQLIDWLAYPDQRVRLESQFELVRREARESLQEATRPSNPKLVRVHGIWGLGQLGMIADLERLLGDEDPEMNVQALRCLRDQQQSVSVDNILPLLEHDLPRLRANAGLYLWKHPHPEALDAITGMLEKNGGEDHYLRHAGVMALVGLKTGGRLADSKSEEVRLAEVMALRKARDPAIAIYLNDLSEAIVTEAALAIHDDFSIEVALPALAESLGARDLSDEKYLRRAINANLRLGLPEHAKRVAEWAQRTRNRPMQKVALQALLDWVGPSEFDAVDGRIRKFSVRDPKAIAGAVDESMQKILSGSDREALALALPIARAYELKIDLQLMETVLRDEEASTLERMAAFETVFKDPDRRKESIQLVLDSGDSVLRVAALQGMVRVKDKAAEDTAWSLVKFGKMSEQQAGVMALQQLDAREKVGSLVKELIAGVLPGHLRLETLEAGQALGIKEGFPEFMEQRINPMLVSSFQECLEGGNVREGEKVFRNHMAAQCVRCHKAGNEKGSIIGPNMKGISKKGAEYLLEALIEPRKDIAKGYGNISLTLKDGTHIAGQFREEKSTIIEVRDATSGKETMIPKDEIMEKSDVLSIMPPMGALLTRREIRDVLAFLMSLESP